MIEIQQWRSVIGTFNPPVSRKSAPKEKKCVTLRGLSSWTVLCMLFVCSLTAHPAPNVNTLLLAGDIERNPGPGMEEGKEILAELRALRKEHEDHFEFLRNETSLIKTEMKNMRNEIEEMRNQIHTQSLDIDAINSTVEEVQKKVTEVGDEVEKLERYSRRENIILHGIPENDSSERTGSVKSQLTGLLNEHAKDKLWNESDFVRAHRLGVSSTPGRPRPIIARLRDHDDKFILIKARGELKSQGIGVANDLTPLQRAELRKLRDEGKRGYFKGGKLCIDPNPLPHVASDTSPSRGQGQHLEQGHERGRNDHRDGATRRQPSPPVTRRQTGRNDRGRRRQTFGPPNHHNNRHK